MVAPILSARLAAARREEERCRAEEALRRSEEKYRQLAEGTEAILWEYHIPSDCWTYVAPQAEKLLGYPPQEWTGLRFWVDHIHEEDRDWAKRYCLECTCRGEPHTFEYRFLARDGRVVWLRDVVSVEMDGGEPLRLRGFMVDITRSKELERLKEDVDRITRHDLKSPLNGIISMPQILMEEGNLSRKQKDILRDIQGAGQRMLYMINMSLGLYQMEQGTYELEPKPVDLLPVLSEVERDLDTLRSGYEIALSLDVEGDAPRDNTAFFVLGERSLCYSMLSNLVKNAVEASPRGGSVWISLREGEQGRARIVVGNQGSIPASLRERFGEKYATVGKRYGTGLGVYSARLIAETMNGTFTWSSSREQGTSVHITLPLADDDS
jgi:PAS domain S-box-containing protein